MIGGSHSDVGRDEEPHALRGAVADQEGKVVLVIGGEGRGKSALLAELNRQLAQEPFYFPLLYQLNDKDMSDAFLGRLMDDLLNIGGLTKGKLILGVPDQAQRWRELLDTATGFGKVPIIGPLFQPVSSIAGLLKQLVRDDLAGESAREAVDLYRGSVDSMPLLRHSLALALEVLASAQLAERVRRLREIREGRRDVEPA
jgi:hypothetical protein